MQRMQMRMRLALKHVTYYAQHLVEVYSELFAKIVNDLKPLKTFIAKGPPSVFGRVLSPPLVFV